MDVFAQRIVGWHASSSMRTDLVMTPLRIALWQRDREGNPILPGVLISHSDAGAQYTSIRYTEHLDLEGIISQKTQQVWQSLPYFYGLSYVLLSR